MFRKSFFLLLTLILSACLPGFTPAKVVSITHTITAAMPAALTATPAAGASPTVAAAALPTSGKSAQYLVLISIDAGRPEYFDLTPMPNLEALTAGGTSYTDAWVGSLENNTPPGHTVMSTGTFPGHNGILTFKWTNSETGELVNPTTLDAINHGDMARIVAESGVPTIAGLVKTAWPDATVAAVSAQKYYAAQGLGMGPTDYILYGEKPAAKFLGGTPGVEAPIGKMLVPAALDGHEPPAGLLDDPALRVALKKPGDENTFALHLALALFEKEQPRALLINLPASDEYGHSTGGITAPDTLRQVMEATDRGIGELVAAYKAAGIFEQTLWIITADHGMSPNQHTVEDSSIRQAVRQAGGKTSDSEAQANAVASAQIPGITGVYARVKTASGYEYRPANETLKNLPADLNAAYLYLLSTYAGSGSPDVVKMLAANTTIGTALGTKTPMHGSHNGPTWSNQHIPLIIHGPGVRPKATSAAPARLVDLLPTISRLMGFPVTGMDGVVLADALLQPSPTDTDTQSAVNARLAPLRDALRQAGSQ